MDRREALRRIRRNHHERRVRSGEILRLEKLGRLDAVAAMQKEMDAFYAECLKIKAGDGIKQDHRVALGQLSVMQMLARAEKQAAELDPSEVIARIDAELVKVAVRVAHLRAIPTQAAQNQWFRWKEYEAKLQQHREGICRG